jgi:hypothetical protein
LGRLIQPKMTFSYLIWFDLNFVAQDVAFGEGYPAEEWTIEVRGDAIVAVNRACAHEGLMPPMEVKTKP